MDTRSYAMVELGDDSPERMERFAQRVAEHGNYSLAYREVFRPSATTAPRTIWNHAAAFANRPNVMARIRELNRERTAGALISARELVNDWVDIATADPNDIVRHEVGCCRNCWGTEFAYQWRDMQEWVDECVKRAEDAVPKGPPEMKGGFGFNGHREPNEACPYCYGNGIGRTIIADTTKLTGKARKLFKGIREDRFGAVEVLLHDQEAARQSLGKAMRLLGNDPQPIEPPKLPGQVIEQEVSPIAAATAYLSMVK